MRYLIDYTIVNHPPQLSILNAASIFGRTVPSIFAPNLGVFNLLAFFTAGSGVVILCMAAIKDVAGVVVFAIFYGFFSGGGTYHPAIYFYKASC